MRRPHSESWGTISDIASKEEWRIVFFTEWESQSLSWIALTWFLCLELRHIAALCDFKHIICLQNCRWQFLKNPFVCFLTYTRIFLNFLSQWKLLLIWRQPIQNNTCFTSQFQLELISCLHVQMMCGKPTCCSIEMSSRRRMDAAQGLPCGYRLR